MGLPRCSWLVCLWSAETLPLPHNCGKSHTRGTNLRHSGVQSSSSHSSHSHTHGTNCPWGEKLTCPLHNAPHIACNNQLLSIDALHQAIQQWTTTKRPPQANLLCATLSNTRTRPRSILRPMHRPQEDRPPASPPRVVIPKPPSILVPQIPIASQDEPIARCTGSRFSSMDRSPPRVHKTIDTAPIVRRTRSQTANMASVITPAQAAQQQYPVKFLQSLAMPVIDDIPESTT